MASRLTMRRQLRAMEAWLGVRAAPDPTLFVELVDASIPEPQEGGPPELEPVPELTITGAKPSLGNRPLVARLPGESVADLKARAMAMLPDVRVFLFEYG